MAKIKKLTEQLLMDYEEQYFDVFKADKVRGVARYSDANLRAAVLAGWFDEEVEPAKMTHKEKRALSLEIEKVYAEAIHIDPNG